MNNTTTKYTLAGLGLTMGLAVAAAAAPALAAPTKPEPISAQVTKATSASRQTSSEVSVEGTWATPHLTAGSTLTVGSVDGGFGERISPSPWTTAPRSASASPTRHSSSAR